ncbi:MAG: T9SS type A sorting domain-containing protein, partial [Bacteroidetes bacterium]|nr:T9SS type A sorting domain-containing protein [Bacteroidota bacterium]
SVLQEDNILYEESSTPVSVEDFGEQVLWLESEGFTAIETGTYDVKYEFSTEDEGIFTTRYDELIVTDSILSGSDYHFYYTVGYQDFNPDWRGKYGQEYTIIQPDTLTGISNFFRADSATTVHFSIYGMNGGLPTDQPIYISGPITFDSTFNGWHYHHLPEAIILDQGAYVFAMEHNTSPGFLSLRWDTDFQTTGVWSDIPEVTDGWEPYQSLFNVSKICGTMITPVFGQKEVITNTSQPILPAWTVDVHPNPFVNQISVSINAAHTMYFQLLDTKGQVLQTFESKGKTTIDKDLSDLPSGTYFLSVSDGEGLTVKRMVKR